MAQVTYSSSSMTQLINGYNALDSDFRSGGLTRETLSAVDNGGLGSLSYSSVTGIISYTGASDSDIRNLFSVGSGLTYDSATGQFNATVVNDATNAIKGIAIFDSGDFIAIAGAISINELDSADIANGAIVAAKIGSGAVSSSKFATSVAMVVYNSSGSVVKTLYGAGS